MRGRRCQQKEGLTNKLKRKSWQRPDLLRPPRPADLCSGGGGTCAAATTPPSHSSPPRTLLQLEVEFHILLKLKAVSCALL